MIDVLSPFLAFLAGTLSILSPCVLPLVPIVLGSAQSRHPMGPLVLGAGLALSFTLIGLFVATIGFSVGLDGEAFRLVGGVLLATLGIVLLSPPLQTRLAAAAGPVGSWANGRIQLVEERGLVWQGALGALLGLVWLPCVGPTLGAASLLAARGENLGQVTLVMIAFGLGAAVPLVGIGFASARALSGGRNRLGAMGTRAKRVLGAALILVGFLVLSGTDRAVETYLTEVSPDWLVELTTRY